MRIRRGSFESIAALDGRRAVSLGTFDGVHRGHQAILRELRLVASRRELDGAVVVTFGHHPRGVLSAAGAPPSITDLEERVELIAATGIEDLVVLDFDAALSRIPYDAFVRDLLVGRLKMAHFVLGHDVHFGRDRGGNAVTVAELGEDVGFNVSQVASVRDGGEAISSTRIRSALAAGAMDDAVRWSGHPFPVRGVVLAGRGEGRQLGFATANLEPPEGKVRPAEGVYAGWARPDEEWVPMVANLGRAPTLTEGTRVTLEAHLLDTPAGAEGLRGRPLRLALAHRLRGEKKFSSRDELIAAIQADVDRARAWLGQAPEWALPRRLEDLSGPAAP